MALGDFNRDGRPDLVIGSPVSVVQGFDQAGVVHVIYGGENGPDRRGQQVWHLARSGIEGEPYPGSRFGLALAVGDFNCDLVDDLAVGEKDAVTVLYGVEDDELRNVGAQRLTGALDSGFGSALAAGQFADLEGCGEDLAVGLPHTAGGEVNVFFGASGVGLVLSSVTVLDQDSPGVPGAAEPEDLFGSALAAGNFDGDAFDDLAIGAPGEEVAGILLTWSQGAVNVIYGGADGFDLERSQIIHQDTAFVEGKTEEFDRFGSSLAVGNFDGDAFADLAIGVPHENDNGSPLLGGDREWDAGAVNVLRGSSNGLAATQTRPGKLWWQDSEGIKGSNEANDYFGQGVAAADFNGDSYDELAAGVPGEDRNGYVKDGGIVNVIPGGPNALTDVGDYVVHQNTSGQWVEDAIQVKGDLQDGDSFGCSLVGGPLDGDAYDDLVVTSLDGPDVAVNVIFGAGGGLNQLRNDQWICEGENGCSSFSEILNWPSAFAPVTDGVYTDPDEWSDVEPLGFSIGSAAPVAVDPEDTESLDGVFFTALAPEPDPTVAHLNLHVDLLERTDTNVSWGDSIATLRFPVRFGRASGHQILGVHLIGSGPGAPAMPPSAWLDKNGDGQPDDSNGDGQPDVPASSLGIEASAGFAVSPFQATPHLQVELKVPLLLSPDFPDPDGPLASVPDGPGGIYTPEPAFWTIEYVPDTPGAGMQTGASMLIEVLPDGAFQESARLTAERVVDVKVLNDLGDGDGIVQLAVLSVPDTPATRLFGVQLFNGADPGRPVAADYDFPQDVNADGQMDQVMEFLSADLLANDVLTLHSTDVMMTAQNSTETVAGTVPGLALPQAGAVPDGGQQTPGTPLGVKRTGGGGLKLFWDNSCSPDDTDYAVYEGRLGEPGSHRMVTCTTGGATVANITPGPDDHYYLVVPLHPDGVEGSYGVASWGEQRPQGQPSLEEPLAPTSCAIQSYAQACGL